MTSRTGRSLTGAAGLLSMVLLSGCAATSTAVAPSPSPVSSPVTSAVSSTVSRAASSSAPGGAVPPADLEFGLGNAPAVRRAPGVVVAVEHGGPSRQAGHLLRLARRAVRRVEQVVPSAHGRLAVLVPATESDMEAILGAGSGAYADTAAISTTTPSVAGLGNAPRVYVNPAQFERYNSQGQLILLTHEATHVLTGVVDNTTMPLWLVEGFADYVALRDVRLPLATTAKEILAQVRRKGPPTRLPTAADFDAAGLSDSAFGAEYEASWLACRLIAQRAGQRRLVALYEAVERGEGIGTAFRRYVGTGVGSFTRLWRTRLSDWSHRGTG